MKTVLIRHGKTAGNLEGRYIGCGTDEPLCEAGKAEIHGLRAPEVDRVFVSPMKRCLETAAILYPNRAAIIVDDFRECDFGAFENRNYAELNGDPDYQRWIDSGGEMPFPNGESRAAFAARCVSAYEKLRKDFHGDCALIVHGGTIMAIMEKYACPHGRYFDFQLKNADGYLLDADGSYQKLTKGVI